MPNQNVSLSLVIAMVQSIIAKAIDTGSLKQYS